MKGTIARKTNRGYGFIKPHGDDEADDVFFHSSNLDASINFDDLEEGAVVTFDVETGEKGPAAVNVKMAGDEGEAEVTMVAEEADDAGNDEEGDEDLAPAA